MSSSRFCQVGSVICSINVLSFFLSFFFVSEGLGLTMASVNIPKGQMIVKVTVIDTGARITGPISFFMDPPLQEGIGAAAPAYVFLVEHENSGRRILFDLGIHKDFEEYAPVVKAYHKAFEFKQVRKYLTLCEIAVLT
jgi:hypothetical protein